MRPIGYSTGSLCRADFQSALRILHSAAVPCVELSALRIGELATLVEALSYLDLGSYEYISFHAPSRFDGCSEEQVIAQLGPVRERGWPIIVHPDVIKTRHLWNDLGALLCIENMDKRKPTGRNVHELDGLFGDLPKAQFCLDLAHALQIDPTMSQAFSMLMRFGHRLQQVHVSSIDVNCIHRPLSYGAILAYQRVSQLIPEDVPVIMESPLVDLEEDPSSAILREIDRAREALAVPTELEEAPHVFTSAV